MTKPTMDFSNLKCFEARSAVAVFATPEKQSLTIVFDPAPSEDVPGIAIEMHASAVGTMVAQIKDEYAKISMKASDNHGLLMETKLTGARPGWAEDGTPILMLQLDGIFELAVSVTKNQASIVSRVAEELSGPPNAVPIKRH